MANYVHATSMGRCAKCLTRGVLCPHRDERTEVVAGSIKSHDAENCRQSPALMHLTAVGWPSDARIDARARNGVIAMVHRILSYGAVVVLAIVAQAGDAQAQEIEECAAQINAMPIDASVDTAGVRTVRVAGFNEQGCSTYSWVQIKTTSVDLAFVAGYWDGPQIPNNDCGHSVVNYALYRKLANGTWELAVTRNENGTDERNVHMRFGFLRPDLVCDYETSSAVPKNSGPFVQRDVSGASEYRLAIQSWQHNHRVGQPGAPCAGENCQWGSKVVVRLLTR